MNVKKFLIVLFCCILVFNTCYTQEARAEGFAAVAIASGGLDFAAIGATASTIGAVALPYLAVIAVLVASAYGVNVYVNKNAETFRTKKQYMYDKLVEYANYLNVSINELAQTASRGISVASTGVINFTKSTATWWNDFFTWLITSDTLTQEIPKSGNFVNDIPVSKINGTYFQSSVNYRYAYNFSQPIYAFYDSSLNALILWVESSEQFSRQTFDVRNNKITGTSSVGTTTSSFSWRYQALTNFTNYDWNRTLINNGSIATYPTGLTGTGSLGSWLGANVMGIYATDIPAIGNSLVGDPSEVIDDAIALDPSIADELGADVPITVDPLEYIDILDGAIEGDTPIINDIPIVVPNIVVPEIRPDNPPIEEPEEEFPPDNGDTAVTGYMFDLTYIFPFCIPFDLVRLIKKFVAEPKAPEFSWRFYIPNVIDYTLNISLEQWSSVAAIFRRMMSVFYIVSLILVSRKLIRL